MLWLIPFTIALASGWFLARALTAGAWNGPRWAVLLVEVSLGALFGPGLASILYFALVAARVANAVSVFATLIAMLAGSAGLWWRVTPRSVRDGETRRKFPYAWALWIGAALGLVLFLMDFQTASSANPFGEWDAVSIWNLRAHYMASGGALWLRAVSPELGGHMVGAAHPGYPLFLSGFIGLQWSAAKGFDEAAPIAASLLFAIAALALLGASLAARRSVPLGLLAWLVLFASEVFASQTAAQYSDLPQGLAFLSALVLLEAAAERGNRRLLFAVGLAIGLSAWIKDEGLVFAAAALAVAVWRFGRQGAVPVIVGSLPGLIACAVLKLVFVAGREEMFPRSMGEMVARIAGAGRWWQAGLGFAKAVWDAGSWWTHPVLLMALLAVALRFVPTPDIRGGRWLMLPIAITAAAEYFIYLITAADLDWHISTSVSRLLAQLWPSILWLLFMSLRAPEEAFPEAVTARATASAVGGEASGKRKRR